MSSVLDNMQREAQRGHRNEQLQAQMPWGIMTASPLMRDIIQFITRIARSDIPVLITGESGVGKELIASALHCASGLPKYLAVNSAGLGEQLVDAEILGYVKGAFTGAERDKPGIMESIDGGTLFLDEIGDLPLPAQAHLLRVLQSGEVRRVGSTTVRKVRVRIVTATNRDLESEVIHGRFRRDLYRRIAGARIHVPPLRERPEDIPLLATHFAGAHRLGDDVIRHLQTYDWPENVGQLEMSLRVARALAGNGPITIEHFPMLNTEIPSRNDSTFRSLRDMERHYILQVLEAVGGNIKKAAELLGVDRGTIRRKMRQH